MSDRRHTLVTGGSGVVGAAIVGTLLTSGEAVITTHTHPGTDRLIPEANRLVVVRADLSAPGGVSALLEEIEGLGLEVGSVVHAAAIVDTTDSTELDSTRFSEVLAVNVTAAYDLTWRLSRRSHLDSAVLVSSIASDFPHLGSVAYTTSKGAINALTRALALELAPTRVNAVAPGIVRSARTANDPDFADGDLIDARDVAELVAYLVGPRSSALTGQILRIDGGRTLHLL